MMKIIALAALTTFTIAQEMPGIETRDGSVVFLAPNEVAFVRDKTEQSSRQELNGMDSALKSKAGGLSDRADALSGLNNDVADNIASSNDAADQSKSIQTSIRQAKSAFDTAEEVSEEVFESKGAEMAKILNDTKNDIEDDLVMAFGALKADLARQKDELDKNVAGKLTAAKETHTALVASAKLLNAVVDATEACTADGLLWDSDKEECVESDVDARKLIPGLYHRHFSNDDGRDHGYITNRYVQFTKMNDDTYIRVIYYDNLRVHGHLAHGQWNVMICDEAGNGCDYCNTPGRLNLWRWSRHQGNWWMNDHVGHTLTGICKRTGNRDLRKGKYMLKTRLENNRYSMYTGHNTDQCNFQVDEVIKY